MFAPENKQQMEQSFKEFAMRPENRALLEQHQREEVAAALQLQEQMQDLNLQQQVSELHPADQNLLAPVLKSAVLRQLLTAMSAAPQPGAEPTAGGDSSAAQLGVWLANPRVLQLLREAAKALRKGLLTEEQLVVLLQQEVKAQQPRADSEEAPLVAAPHQAQLPSHVLVEALNEHLEERRAGNTAYQQRQYDTALHHYNRALAVVNFVVGQSPHDQAQINHNKASVLLNLAAAHMALKEWGAAVQCCNDALQVPGAADDIAARAWLRRAKANLGRHEYEAALRDLQQAEELDAWSDEVPAVRARVLEARQAAEQHVDRQLAAKMLGRR